MSEHILEVKNLCKYFYLGKNKPPMKAVDDVSFYIEKGETVGLVGESGCGKTTTGRTITRQVTSKMQMVFQDPVASLNPRMTVEEIICEGVKINKLYPDKTERRNQVYKMLDMVGLTREHATRYPHEFSGGQRQRICIARALITQPDLLIADEPISALDVSIQAQILNILNDLRKELGLTILFIAHDLSVVKYFSNRVAVMNAGRIVEMSSSDEIYRDPQHAYTKSLLSAIPVPDPLVEKKRQRIHYDKASGVYQPEDNPLLREIKPGHFVLMSDNEWAAYQKANA